MPYMNINSFSLQRRIIMKCVVGGWQFQTSFSQQPCSPGQLPVVRSGQGGAGPCSAYGEKGHGGPVSRAAAGVILVWCPAVA